MEFYPVPSVTFDAAESERVRKKEAGDVAITIITAWKNGFEKFWQTPRTHSERAISRDNLQATIDRDPVGFGDILRDSAAFRQHIIDNYPEHVGSPNRDTENGGMTREEDEAKLLPSRYLVTPFPITIGAGTITIDGPVVPEWDVQQEN